MTPSGQIHWQEWVDRGIFDKTGRLVELQSVGRDITDRKLAEEALHQTQRTLETLISNLPGLVYRCRHDENWTMEFASDGCLELTGYSSVDFVTHQKVSFIELVHPDDLEMISVEMDEAISEKRAFEMVYRIITAQGEEKWVWEQGRAIFEEDGDFSALEGFITDITEQKQSQLALWEVKEKALVTLSSIGDAVITTDPDGVIDYMNPVAEKLIGCSLQAAAGKCVTDICQILNEQTRIPLDSLPEQPLSGRQQPGAQAHAILLNRDGQEYTVEMTVSPICGQDREVNGIVTVFRDVSDARTLQRHLVHQATHDSLTGLVNRYEFEERLRQLLTDANENGTQHALCYVDLDQFKVVNDTCGHTAGDTLLSNLAVVLRATIRSGDTLARLGGDEFGVLLANCHPEDALDKAAALLSTIQEFRFNWHEERFTVGASIGVVPVDAGSRDKAALMSAADAACYAAKDGGRNRVHYYHTEDEDLAQRQGEMQWVARIHDAMEHNRFELFYQTIQPVTPGRGNSGKHFELLIRMRDAEGQLIPPGAFLPAAERYNLMPIIDRWVIDTAFDWLECHPDAVHELGHCAINLSGPTLSDEHFLEYLVGKFSRTTVPADKICFEITETAAISNLVKATHFINTLRKLGCAFSLDDFGSGMSSFAYLRSLPVDFLKIEGMFVRDILDDPIDFAMVKSINEMGHAMGKQTIAEFVENEAILDKLREIGVDFAQGYGIARPEPLAMLGKDSGKQ